MTEILNERFLFEEAVHRLNIPASRKQGTVKNAKWFINNGHKSNRFKDKYPDALQHAKTIIEKQQCMKKQTKARRLREVVTA